MGHRINVTIDDSAWEELQQIPEGERSRLISEAVGRALLRREREKAAAGMDRLRKTSCRKSASAEDMVRADREAHRSA